MEASCIGHAEGIEKSLIMLHGWGLDSSALKPLAMLVSDIRKIHCLDLPGFGKSKTPSKAWSSKDYALCLFEYMESQGIDKVDLFGHSFGGKVAARFAAMYPQRVGKLILAAASGLQRKRSLKEKIQFFAIKVLGKMAKILDKSLKAPFYYGSFVEKFGSKDYKSAGDLKPTLVLTLREDLTGVFSQIKAETLLLWGLKDTETPVEMGLRIHHLIKDSKFIGLENRGHAPFEDVGAHLLAKYILQFLKE